MRRMVRLRGRAHIGNALQKVVFEGARAASELVSAAQRAAVPGAPLANLVLCKQ